LNSPAVGPSKPNSKAGVAASSRSGAISDELPDATSDEMRDRRPLEDTGAKRMTAPTGSKNQLPPGHSPITTKGARETRGDAAHEEQGQQAMSAILLIPVAVGFILFVVCLLVYLLYGRGDEDDDDRGILGVLSDLLSWW
jgi:hypothetical protein